MKKKKSISGVSENLSKSIIEKEKKVSEFNKNALLFGRKIAISVSSSEDLEILGLSENHLKDISIEIARYLIVNGATLLYGGDLRRDGYTEIFSELSYQYKFLNDKKPRFINYFPFPNARKLSSNDKAELIKKQVEPLILKPPDHLGNPDPTRDYNPRNIIEDRYLFAECYTHMRHQMVKDSDARIVLGGIHKNFTGYYPGILEETLYSLQANQPLFLIGGFGGVAKSIIELISGKEVFQISNEFQYDTDFLKQFRDYASPRSKVEMDYKIIVEFFNNCSIDKVSKQNGLTIEENRILFESSNIHELVFLIIKGLKTILTT